MTEPDDLIHQLLAHITVLEQFVTTFFVSANDGAVTAETLLQMAEHTKQQYERGQYTPEGAAHLTAAVDMLFNRIASQVREDEGNQPHAPP